MKEFNNRKIDKDIEYFIYRLMFLLDFDYPLDSLFIVLFKRN